MPHIFISYAKNDTQDLAFALCDWFNDLQGYTAWVDRSLKAGRSWEGDIQREIRRCDIFVVLYSPDINRHLHDPDIPESYVLEEISYARYTLKKTIIPVMAQEAEPPMGMTRLQYIDFAAGGMSINALALRILQEAGQAPAPPASPPHTPISPLPAQRSGEGSGVRAKPRSSDLLPAPFAWVEIPARAGSPGYSIAKYPVTNAQFAKFIEAGGYSTQRWWTSAGWQQRQKDDLTEPRYWRDSKWNGAEQPVVGVSWYEAVAFCLWLSDVTGEKIMLPTEDQWQYAAQGDDGRDYPWGNDWDCKRCNNSVKPCDSNVTTPVTHYEGKNKGDSPFGVVDMAGNVWEWCLTDHDNKTNDMNSNTTYRVLRGGSWIIINTYWFRCDNRNGNYPHVRYDYDGFRLSLS